MEFFRPTLSKIVIAKAIGVPLLFADLFFNVFSFVQFNLAVKLIVLIIASYSVACAVDFFVLQRRLK